MSEIELVSESKLPTKYGKFSIYAFKEHNKEHIAIAKGEFKNKKVTVRIHSKCLTGDTFRSLRCDCGEQLEKSLIFIGKHGGVLVYLDQEGRGIGLSNKIKAYALQDKGMDTIEANECLGFDGDVRDYGAAVEILSALKISSIVLMTNNPKKMDAMSRGGISVERMPLKVKPNEFNEGYIETKRLKSGHLA
ncbi:MAG: GTP cyclohydrolase II [Candidatus Aenigmarchaeota archaeon]|nr:GTP cyclohydrolase II [Candidatus Aenigmarchaeota archaeon]